jgi:hypothetical protein
LRGHLAGSLSASLAGEGAGREGRGILCGVEVGSRDSVGWFLCASSGCI